jgi:hypothetical protein
LADPGRPESAAERVNMACFELSREVAGLECSVPEAAPLARTLLRVVGRVVIDTGPAGADPSLWPDTREMALLWIRDALRPLGYDVTPLPGSGSPDLPPTTSGA